MKRAAFAIDFLLWPFSLDCPAPARCPYCPVDAPPHWIRWGSYQRYAGDPEDPCRRADIARYRCKIVKRTFSLLPDALLPYCGIRAGLVLCWLRALLVDGIGANTLARQFGVGRAALRCLKARFLRAIPKLRLPRREGALPAATFIEVLARTHPVLVTELFRDWKELEPKHSVVGIYLRC